MRTAIALYLHIEDFCLSLKILHFENILGKFRPRKVDFLETARLGSRGDKYNFIWSTFRKAGQPRSKKYRGIQKFERNYHETKYKR